MLDLSDNKMPIKYILIGNSSTSHIIIDFSIGNQAQKTKREINRIYNKLIKLPNKKYDERKKIISKDNNYYFIYIKPDLLFIVLADNKYPERNVFELISKVVEENITTMVNNKTRELNPSGRQALEELVNKYQDIKNISKIEQIEDIIKIKADEVNKNCSDKKLEDLEYLINNLKNENKKLKEDLLKANKIIDNFRNNDENNNEIKNLKGENMNLKYQLLQKDNEIKSLKIQLLENNKEIDNKKFDMIVYFQSLDQEINHVAIKCTSFETFAENEEKLYKKYDNFRNTNNTPICNGQPVLRFKTLYENKIKDEDVVQIITIE